MSCLQLTSDTSTVSNNTLQGTRFQNPACRMDSVWHDALGPQGLIAGVLYTVNGMLRYTLHCCITSNIFQQAGMGRFYEIRIYVGYGLVLVSYLVVVFNLFFSCRPFHRNWQINPDPGGM